jgi:hypothetical protein
MNPSWLRKACRLASILHFSLLEILANSKLYNSSKSTPSRSCLDTFESDLWNRHILQLSLLEPGLYYATTALVGNWARSNCLLQSKGACCNVQGRVAARGRKRPSRVAGKQVAVGGVVQGTTGGGGLAGPGMERYLWAGMERGGQDLVELGLIKDDARLRKRTNAEL